MKEPLGMSRGTATTSPNLEVLTTYETGADVAGSLAALTILALLVWSSAILRAAHLAFQQGESVPVLWHAVGQVLLLILGGVTAAWLGAAGRRVRTNGPRWLRTALLVTMAGTTVFTLTIHALGATTCFLSCRAWV